MKQFGLTVFLGILLSLPFLYILELRTIGSIAFLIFLCVALLTILMPIIGHFGKKGSQE